MYVHNLVDGLAPLPMNSNLISGNKIPVLDMVLWFCGLDNGVPGGRPPFPMTIGGQETPGAFGVWAGRPGLEGSFLLSDRRCWLVVHRRVRTVEAPCVDPGRDNKRLMEVTDAVSVRGWGEVACCIADREGKLSMLGERSCWDIGVGISPTFCSLGMVPRFTTVSSGVCGGEKVRSVYPGTARSSQH